MSGEGASVIHKVITYEACVFKLFALVDVSIECFRLKNTDRGGGSPSLRGANKKGGLWKYFCYNCPKIHRVGIVQSNQIAALSHM